ncbi:MAG: ATP-binding cassette domain-containing protein [Christensenellaceae bacterium]|jgi:phosphate transport system ATP-binding protein|nr:ATP-binding cassette domain-containing protein [Christensenellaceae bacterium]
MPAALSVSGLNLRYGSQEVLLDLSLEILPGHILALIGPEDGGKSSLLRAINRMADEEGASYCGNILLNGESIFLKDAVALRRVIGMVPPTPVLFRGSVFDNIVAGLRLQGRRGEAELRGLAESALEQMGLAKEYAPLLGERAESLPLPAKQMVAFLRALALEPELLLLDEPARSLDAAGTAHMEEALCRIKKRCTILLATNTLQQAGRIADETALLIDGRIVEYGETAELFSNPRARQTEDYLTGRYREKVSLSL